MFCQPEDADTLRGHGFADVRPVDDAVDCDGIRIARTAARHGSGEIGEAMAPVSASCSRARRAGLYIAGDTIWCDEVARGARPRTGPAASSSTPAPRASSRATRS